MSAPLSDAELVEAIAAALSDADGRVLGSRIGSRDRDPYNRRACLMWLRGLWAVTPAGDLVEVEG